MILPVTLCSPNFGLSDLTALLQTFTPQGTGTCFATLWECYLSTILHGWVILVIQVSAYNFAFSGRSILTALCRAIPHVQFFSVALIRTCNYLLVSFIIFRLPQCFPRLRVKAWTWSYLICILSTQYGA